MTSSILSDTKHANLILMVVIVVLAQLAIAAVLFWILKVRNRGSSNRRTIDVRPQYHLRTSGLQSLDVTNQHFRLSMH